MYTNEATAIMYMKAILVMFILEMNYIPVFELDEELEDNGYSTVSVTGRGNDIIIPDILDKLSTFLAKVVPLLPEDFRRIDVLSVSPTFPLQKNREHMFTVELIFNDEED